MANPGSGGWGGGGGGGVNKGERGGRVKMLNTEKNSAQLNSMLYLSRFIWQMRTAETTAVLFQCVIPK